MYDKIENIALKDYQIIDNYSQVSTKTFFYTALSSHVMDKCKKKIYSFISFKFNHLIHVYSTKR